MDDVGRTAGEAAQVERWRRQGWWSGVLAVALGAIALVGALLGVDLLAAFCGLVALVLAVVAYAMLQRVRADGPPGPRSVLGERAARVVAIGWGSALLLRFVAGATTDGRLPTWVAVVVNLLGVAATVGFVVMLLAGRRPDGPGTGGAR